jgi:hypothetical protein
MSNDPFALGGVQDDAEIAAAYDRLEILHRRWAEPPQPLSDDEANKLTFAESDEIEFINTTPPRTMAGVVIKLRVLAHPEHGFEAGPRWDECDLLSLRQVTDFIEREGRP